MVLQGCRKFQHDWSAADYEIYYLGIDATWVLHNVETSMHDLNNADWQQMCIRSVIAVWDCDTRLQFGSQIAICEH